MKRRLLHICYTRRLLCRAAFVIIMIMASSAARAEHFPVPDVIKHNVAFWIKIYTEVGLKEGLLHDRDYPQIVYEKVIHGDRTGKRLREYNDSRRDIYVKAIKSVRDSSQEKWGDAEKRVAELFKQLPPGAAADAENRIRHQTGQRERFKQGLERSSMYIDTIAAILKKHRVPDELKYLPHVESSFNYEAYSKVGAAGLWQFMRSTGRGYMRVDYMIDERSDPIISTEAAARFLRANYDMLKAWPIAVTAYNHGPNGMRRAVETVGSRDIADILQKHESSTFKFASKNFYSCFVAVLQIMEKPEKYFKNINYKPKWEAVSVKLPAAMTPNAVIKATGVSEAEFKKMNPSFRPVMFSQQKVIPANYAINLPSAINSDEALAALTRSAPPLPQRPPPATVASSRPSPKERTIPADAPIARVAEGEDGYYTVVRGDNLNTIARRVGMPMNELARANNITNSSRIYVGQVLRIPGASADTGVIVDTAVTVASSSSTTDSIVTVAPSSIIDTAVTVASPTPPKIRNLRVYVSSAYGIDHVDDAIVSSPKSSATTKPVEAAKSPDTAKSIDIAKSTDTISAAAALREADAAPAAPVNPDGKPTVDSRFDATIYSLDIRPAADGKTARVRVSIDETIGHLAEWSRVNNDDIRKLNDFGPDDKLLLGQRITIPVRSEGHLKRFEALRLQYHMAIEEDFFAHYYVADFDQRKLRSGENLWRLCNDAQIPMWLLKKSNRNVDFYNPRAGVKLWIPRVAAKDSSLDTSHDFAPSVTESETE